MIEDRFDHPEFEAVRQRIALDFKDKVSIIETTSESPKLSLSATQRVNNFYLLSLTSSSKITEIDQMNTLRDQLAETLHPPMFDRVFYEYDGTNKSKARIKGDFLFFPTIEAVLITGGGDDKDREIIPCLDILTITLYPDPLLGQAYLDSKKLGLWDRLPEPEEGNKKYLRSLWHGMDLHLYTGNLIPAD